MQPIHWKRKAQNKYTTAQLRPNESTIITTTFSYHDDKSNQTKPKPKPKQNRNELNTRHSATFIPAPLNAKKIYKINSNNNSYVYLRITTDQMPISYYLLESLSLEANCHQSQIKYTPMERNRHIFLAKQKYLYIQINESI